MFDYEMLRIIWWGLLGVLLIGFALTDGFDLGVAALLPFVARSDVERRQVINSIGPTWEGNQVWFILGGGAIFAAWPFDFYDVGAMQRQLIACEGARVDLREIDHADPFEWLGHTALLCGRRFDIPLAALFRNLLIAVELRPTACDFFVGHLLDIAEVQLPARVVAPT